MLKKLVIAIGLIVVVIAVGVYYFAQNIEGLVKTAIQETGTKVTQVGVSLSDVNIDLGAKKASLIGLNVANPAGFKTAKAIGLGEISVTLGNQLSPDLIEIEEILISAPEVTYEISTGGSNIATIQQNVENFANAAGGGQASGSGSASSSGEEGPKLIINNFIIRGGKVNVSASIMQGKTLTTSLPNIHLKDIGKKEGGASPGEVVDQIISEISKVSGNAASGLDLSQLGVENIMGDVLSGAGDVGKQVGGTATKALEGVGGAAKDTMDKAGGVLKGILGN